MNQFLRRELKYQIPPSLVQSICKFIEPFCQMDSHSKIAKDNYYYINSLYFDNEDKLLLTSKQNNQTNRFNMRIRSYGQSPNFPVWLEIKYKHNSWINKIRGKITSQDTLKVLEDMGDPDQHPDFSNQALKQGFFYIRRLHLRPAVMTQYQRMAFVGLNETYSRITFDRRLKCYSEQNYSFVPQEYKFMSYDHCEQYQSPNQSIILELKCEAKIPAWMRMLVQHFQLENFSFSKYSSSHNYLFEAQSIEFDRISFI